MSRRDFSDFVIETASSLDMSVQEFAAAVGQPVEVIRERARAAGSVLRGMYDRIGQDIPKATSAGPYAACVFLELRSLG